MKKRLEILLFSFFLICSCASKPLVPVSPEWRYEKEAIHLEFKSDPRLNFYQGSSHTLLVCVYQLSDPNAFNQLKEEKEGLVKLLDCSRFDPSVASSKKLVIQPGQGVTTALDRAEGAKYVGITAGYYQLEKDRMIRLVPIPVFEEKKGWIFKTRIPKVAVLNVNLFFGPREIQDSKGK